MNKIELTRYLRAGEWKNTLFYRHEDLHSVPRTWPSSTCLSAQGWGTTGRLQSLVNKASFRFRKIK